MARRVVLLTASILIGCLAAVCGAEERLPTSQSAEVQAGQPGSAGEPLGSPGQQPGPAFGFSSPLPPQTDVPSADKTPAGPKREGSPMDLPMGGMGAGSGPFQYRTIWFPDAPVTGQAARWGMIGQDLSVMLPVYTSKPDFVCVSAGVDQRHIETSAQLLDTHREYPENLWNVRLGLNYFRTLDNGWVTGAMVNVGSASDRPFASINEITAGFIGFLRMPSGDRHAWLFSLMYSPTSELGFPLPGVALDYHPSDDFRANIGLPLSVMYRPAEDWTLDASYFPIRTIRVKATRRFGESLSVFASYDWSNESYFLYDRAEYDDRFFLYDQRVSLGVQYKLTPQLTLDFSTGYSFDRYSYEGNVWGTRQYDRVQLGSTPFAAFRTGWRF